MAEETLTKTDDELPDYVQSTFDEILKGKDDTSVAEETLDLESRERLEEQRAARAAAEQAEQTATPAEDATATEGEADETKESGDVPRPAWMSDEYLDKEPNAQKAWTHLRKQSRANKREAEESRKALDDLRAEVERLKAAPAPQPVQPAPVQQQPAQAPALPDPTIDPHGYARALHAQQAEMVQNVKLDMSEAQAVRTHGKDKVDQAFQWAQTQAQGNPAFWQGIAGRLDPWGSLVEEMDRSALLSEIGSDPAAYRERLMEQVRAEMAAEFAERQAAGVEEEIERRVKVPTSLASVPGTGSTARGGDAAFSGPTSMADILPGNN